MNNNMTNSDSNTEEYNFDTPVIDKIDMGTITS